MSGPRIQGLCAALLFALACTPTGPDDGALRVASNLACCELRSSAATKPLQGELCFGPTWIPRRVQAALARLGTPEPAPRRVDGEFRVRASVPHGPRVRAPIRCVDSRGDERSGL